MKRIKSVVSVFVGLVAIFMLCKWNGGIRAFASCDLNTSIEVVDTEIDNDEMHIMLGDIKVSYVLANNYGYTNFCARFNYNPSKLQVVKQKNSWQAAFTIGDAGEGQSFTFIDNHSSGILGFSTMGDFNSQSDDLVSVYFRPIPNAISETDQISDLIYAPEIETLLDLSNQHPNTDDPSGAVDYTISEQFEYFVPVSYSFKLGNINGDDNITVADAQNILLMLSAYQGVLTTDTETNVFDNDPNFSGLFIEINGVSTLVLQVADVNFDGIIDTTDASLVLQYVVEGVSGTPHPDECQIGEVQTRVKYFLCFTN